MRRMPYVSPCFPRGALGVLAALSLGATIGCGSEPEAERPAPAAPAVVQVPESSAPRPHAILDVVGMGEIRIALLSELAPETVENFITLAEQDFYDGVTFHRVIADFMLQTGDPNTKNRDPRDDGLGGPPHFIPDEFSEISHQRGLVSMANKTRPNSGGSQFFILVADAFHLDGKHAVFGQVTAGMDVVDRIAAVEVDLYGRHGPRDRPLEDVIVADVRIERAEAPSPDLTEDPQARPQELP